MVIDILEAIQKGIEKSFNFEIDSDKHSSVNIKKSKIKSNSLNIWVYDKYQEKYKKLIEKKDFQGCLDLYNSGELNQKAKTIGYEVSSKKELSTLVNNFNDEKYAGFDLNWINVSQINDMSYMFDELENFNCDISEWNVSNVTDMHCMFAQCFNFNQDISKWNVSNVTNMEYMFHRCVNFNQPLNDWDVSNVENMSTMFMMCLAFNQPLNKWNVSNVKNMSYMFAHCFDFDQDISSWDVSNVVYFQRMFFYCSFNRDITSWHISKNAKCLSIFDNCIIENKNMPLSLKINKEEP